MSSQRIETDERYVAVLTGDLVGSTSHRYSQPENSPGHALDSLVDALRFVTVELLHGRVVGFDLFRGDSFLRYSSRTIKCSVCCSLDPDAPSFKILTYLSTLAGARCPNRDRHRQSEFLFRRASFRIRRQRVS